MIQPYTVAVRRSPTFAIIVLIGRVSRHDIPIPEQHQTSVVYIEARTEQEAVQIVLASEAYHGL